MELERERGKLEAAGVNIAALSYDPAALLAEFGERKGIGYPLLSDPGSAIIGRLGLLSPAFPPDHNLHGVPHPVTFLIGADGVIAERHVEESYRQRRTLSSILVHRGMAADDAVSDLLVEHFGLRTAASSDLAYPGQRFTLSLAFDLKDGFHAYAPGDHDYRALELLLDEHPLLEPGETLRPEAKSFHFAPLDETVPVYEGQVRLLQDVVLRAGKETYEMADAGKPLEITGKLLYQICSDTICFPPTELAVSWTLEMEPGILERAPEALRQE